MRKALNKAGKADWRHEEKYILNESEASRIISRVSAVCKPDIHYENGIYRISSLYFDDYKLTAMNEKISGLSVHTKYRIRTYNGSDGRITLERKDKIGTLTQKHSEQLDVELLFSASGTGTNTVTGINPESLLFALKSKGLTPKCIVSYNRRAFSYEPLDIRITFDSAISYLPPQPELLISEKIPGGIPAASGAVIMEIKYNRFIPQHIRSLTACTVPQSSFSKYAACMMRSGLISN